MKTGKPAREGLSDLPLPHQGESAAVLKGGITDGTSNTLMVGEFRARPLRQGIVDGTSNTIAFA